MIRPDIHEDSVPSVLEKVSNQPLLPIAREVIRPILMCNRLKLTDSVLGVIERPLQIALSYVIGRRDTRQHGSGGADKREFQPSESARGIGQLHCQNAPRLHLERNRWRLLVMTRSFSSIEG